MVKSHMYTEFLIYSAVPETLNKRVSHTFTQNKVKDE